MLGWGHHYDYGLTNMQLYDQSEEGEHTDQVANSLHVGKMSENSNTRFNFGRQSDSVVTIMHDLSKRIEEHNDNQIEDNQQILLSQQTQIDGKKLSAKIQLD